MDMEMTATANDLIRMNFSFSDRKPTNTKTIQGLMRDHHTQAMQFDQPKGGERIDD